MKKALFFPLQIGLVGYLGAAASSIQAEAKPVLGEENMQGNRIKINR